MSKFTAKFLLIFGFIMIVTLLFIGIVQSIILNSKQQQASAYSNQIEQTEQNENVPEPER